jgi:hypothetical protein
MTTSIHPNLAESKSRGKRLIALVVLVFAAALLMAAPSFAARKKAADQQTYLVVTMQDAIITSVSSAP